jgi:F-type H+-transporting ATPase subunit a
LLELQQLSPDAVTLWEWGALHVNATLLFTWIVMAVLLLGSLLATTRLSRTEPSRWQMFLELVVEKAHEQTSEVVREAASRYLPFVGSLFLFIAVSNAMMIIPGYVSPMGSLSTTTALAICVFLAVPVYGIARRGAGGYFKHYIEPSIFMLPFHIISELSRTLALAVRLFGNVMSGTKIAALLLAISPLLFPVVMQALGLLTGLVQAYIFAVLALIYIASAARAQEHPQPDPDREKQHD